MFGETRMLIVCSEVVAAADVFSEEITVFAGALLFTLELIISYELETTNERGNSQNYSAEKSLSGKQKVEFRSTRRSPLTARRSLFYIPIIPPNGDSGAGSTISLARSGLISSNLSLASRAVGDIGNGLSSAPFASLAVLAMA